MEVIRGLFDGSVNFSIEKLYIELTNRCNLNCRHCYNESNEGVCLDLPIEIVKNVLIYAKKTKLNSVALSGGEALLYPEINDVLKYCRELNLDVILLTNGTYIQNEKYFELLFEYLPDILVSLDGPDSVSNDVIRGEGSFERAVNFIKALKRRKFPKRVSINTVLTEYTLTNYRNMVALCKELGVDELTFSFVTMAGRAKRNNLQINNNDFYRVVKDINNNIKKSPQNNCQGIGLNHVCSLTNVIDGMINLQPKVACNGDVYPCQMHHKPEYIIGNLNNTNLEGIINGDKTRMFIALMILRKNYMEECSKCVVKDICGRGCMAKSVNDYNNPVAVDGCCVFYKELLIEEIKKKT